METAPRILKDGMVEWWKTPHIVIDRIAERRNIEKHPNPKRWNDEKSSENITDGRITIKP